MRFNVVGADPDTGQTLEMVVDATTAQEAASAAGRRNVHVISVTPVELAAVQARESPPVPLTLGLARPGKGLRSASTFILAGSAVWAFFAPAVTNAVAVAMLTAVGAFALVPTTRSALGRFLGVWPDRPHRGRMKLAFLATYSLLLLGFAQVGQGMQEERRAEEAQRVAQEAARARQAAEAKAQVQTLLDGAEAALKVGDVARGEELARQGTAVSGAPNRSEADALLRKIEGSVDPEFALGMLAKMPEGDFEAFQADGKLTASMDLGFDALNARLLESARGQLSGAVAARSELVAQRAAQAEEAREKAEARAEQERKRQASARAAAEAKANGHPTGKTIRVGYTSYCVWKSWWSGTMSSDSLTGPLRDIQLRRLQDSPTAYLFVDLTVRNDDKKARTIPPLKLIDENGAEYETDSEAIFVEGTFGLLESLNPGVSKQGLLVFHAPRSHTYRLQVDGGFWSSDSALIKLEPTDGR